MKKLLTIIFTCTLLLQLACSTKSAETAVTVTEWSENDLKGNVQSISTYFYDSDGVLTQTYAEQLNENNKLLERIRYDEDSTVDLRQQLSYNSMGNITRERFIRQGGDTTDILYTYNDKDLNTAREERYGEYVLDRTEKEYNDKGELVITRSGEGGHGSEIYYTYDENGRLIRTERLYDYVIYEYDKEGKPTLCKTYENGSDALLMTVSFMYDDKGRLIKETSRDADEPSTLDYDKALAYDDHDRLIELKIVDKDGRVERLITHSYNEKGDMVEEKKLLNHSFLSEVSRYTYDEQGNWVEAEHNFDGAVMRVTRELKYYE